jgi:ABC-2 type transport system ATP-binding protein
MSVHSSNGYAIEVEGLRRSFGNVHAVRDVSFRIESGAVVGFIGANGAGKTTTMRMLVTLDQPDAGRIRIGGVDAMLHPAEVRRVVGWMPDKYGAYRNTTVFEYLDFHARASGLRDAARRERVAEVMDFTELTPLAERESAKLSKGQAQRLCLGRTLLHDPQVLILDEPAAGLDPKARIEFKNLVRLLAERGKTIFISSHILSELGEMCRTMLFLDDGRLVHHGTADSLGELHSDRTIVLVAVAGETERLERWASVAPGVRLLAPQPLGARLELESREPAFVADVLRRMVADGIAVVDFHREQRRLEDTFVEVLKKLEGRA